MSKENKEWGEELTKSYIYKDPEAISKKRSEIMKKRYENPIERELQRQRTLNAQKRDPTLKERFQEGKEKAWNTPGWLEARNEKVSKGVKKMFEEHPELREDRGNNMARGRVEMRKDPDKVNSMIQKMRVSQQKRRQKEREEQE